MTRSPNLNDNTVGEIVAAIGTMDGPVTWATVVAAVKSFTNATYTRQALSKHPSVIAAYQSRKHGLPAEPERRPLSQAARARHKALERDATELQALRAVVWEYEEMMIRIFNNAYALNISEERLLEPFAACEQAPGQSRRVRPPVKARGSKG